MGIEIEEISSDEHRCLIKDMEAMLERAKLPKLESNCCIYKVPIKIQRMNPTAYTPEAVSIGPLHHGDKRLKPMEELKLAYFNSFLERTNMKLEDCIGKVKEKEGYIRGCYADTILQSSDDFVKMIVIDACFIIEHFLRFIEHPPWDKSNLNKSDPILSKPCRSHDVWLDLILLENQLPFFVLEDLFFPIRVDVGYSSFLEVSFHYFTQLYGPTDESKNDETTFDYFREHCLKKRGSTGECEEVKVLHFTDFLRIFYLPRHELLSKRDFEGEDLKYSASQLLEAGLKFNVCQNKTSIELQFEKGVLTMPKLLVHYDTETFLRNIAALEECHYPFETHISEYVVLLDMLIDGRKDVDILIDNGIIVNFLGESNKVVAIFNDICMGMVLPTCSVDYFELSENLNDFYEKPLHKYKAVFIRDYLSTPWKIVSLIAAIVLVLLTLMQSICSIISLPTPGKRLL